MIMLLNKQVDVMHLDELDQDAFMGLVSIFIPDKLRGT